MGNETSQNILDEACAGTMVEERRGGSVFFDPYPYLGEMFKEVRENGEKGYQAVCEIGARKKQECLERKLKVKGFVKNIGETLKMPFVALSNLAKKIQDDADERRELQAKQRAKRRAKAFEEKE